MAKIKTILCIRSYRDDLKIELVEKILPVVPTKIWQKGDRMIVNGIDKLKLYPSSNWSFEHSEIEANNVIDGLVPLLKFLSPYSGNLIELREKYSFETYISQVIQLSSANLLNFSLDYFCITNLASNGLELDYDVYR
jgi:hypothetical protein